MQKAILEYRGRVPKRKGSLAKRNSILRAALEIIKREGIRGVRHRAVADLAQVPLSATTYYFQDIDELIVDAFVYFMQQNISHQQQTFKEMSYLIEVANQRNLDPQTVQHKIKQTFLNYIQQQISEKDSRIIERSFLQYAARIPDLAQKVNQLREYFEQNIAEILLALGDKKARANALLVISVIQYIEEKALLGPEFNILSIEPAIDQLLMNIAQ